MRYPLRLTVFVLLILLLPQAGRAKIVDRILAVVNGEIITQVEFEDYVKLYTRFNPESDQDPSEDAAFRKQLLDQMINELLVVQEADRLEIEVSESEVEAYIKRSKKNNNLSDAEFLEELKQQGLKLEDFKERIIREMKKNRVLNSMIRQKVVVTTDELRNFYEERKDRFKKPRQVHLRLLVVKDRERLAGLREKLLSGELSFSQAAQEYSIGPGAEQGGDLGVLNWKDLGSVWKQALSGLREKEPSDIFELQGHVAILYPEALSPGGVASFEQVKESIREHIYSKKLNDQFLQYISKLRSRAVLDIKHEL